MGGGHMSPLEAIKNLENMKGKVDEFQDSLEEIEATGASGGNMVVATVNGKFEVIDIKLDPLCVDNRDIPMLQDLIIAAIHAAMQNARELIRQKCAPLFAQYGKNFPGLFT